MKCSNCGQEIKADANFCPKCGSKVEIRKAILPKKDSKLMKVSLAAIFLLLIGFIFIFRTFLSNTKESVLWLEDDYNSISPYSEGLAVVSKGAYYGYIDTSGNLAIPAKYIEAKDFSEGNALVKVKGESGEESRYVYINKSGEIEIEPERNTELGITFGKFSCGMAKVETMFGKVGFMDKTGKILTLNYDRIGTTDFREGVAIVYVDGDSYLMTPDLNGIRDWADDYIWSKRGLVKKFDSSNNLVGLEDVNNNPVADVKYTDIYNFENGLAKVIYMEKYGFIDENGNEVIKPEYDDVVGNFSKGKLVGCKKGDKYAIVNSNGKEITDFQYDEVSGCSEGLAVVKKDDKYGVLDENAKTVVGFNYDYISIFSNGFAIVKKDEHYGILKNPIK